MCRYGPKQPGCENYADNHEGSAEEDERAAQQDYKEAICLARFPGDGYMPFDQGNVSEIRFPHEIKGVADQRYRTE